MIERVVRHDVYDLFIWSNVIVYVCLHPIDISLSLLQLTDHTGRKRKG